MNPRGWRCGWKRGLVLAWLAAGACQAQPAEAAAPLRLCLDERSVSVYRFRDAQGRWRGAAIELVELAAQRAGLQLEWRPLPWSRCLLEVAEYAQRRQAEGLVYASAAPERERSMLRSLPLHANLPGVWYSRQEHPQPPLQQRSDLARYRLCGLRSGNFGWLAELGLDGVHSRAPSLKAALEMLQRRHCDLFLLAREPVLGAARLQQLALPEELGFQALPGAAPVTQHLMLSRAAPQARARMERLNQALEALQRSGAAERLYRQHLPEGSGLAAPFSPG